MPGATEENRIQSIFDNGHEKTYKYNDQGQRIIKRGPQGETVYVNQYFTIRNREIGTKHIFAGTSRMVSKLMKQKKPQSKAQGTQPLEKDLYFYHPDHLGSSTYVTDTNGKLYQHLQYFPFGETWVEESTNTQRTPYRFTAKELDEETGLYYYGARYYDPRTSVWQSGDPILGEYLDGNRGLGGVFNPINSALYTYSHQNPVKYVDPTGLDPELAMKVMKQSSRLSGNTKAVLRAGLIKGIYAAEGYRLTLRKGGVRGWVNKYIADPLGASKTVGRGQFNKDIYTEVKEKFGGTEFKAYAKFLGKDKDPTFKLPKSFRNVPDNKDIEDFVVGGALSIWIERSQRPKLGRSKESARSFGIGRYRGGFSQLQAAQNKSNEFVHYGPVEQALRAGTEKQKDLADYIKEVETHSDK